MIGFFKKLWRDKRGNALVIIGAALPLIIGSAGLASDTIQWALWKRQLQRAADSGAMAGVYAIVQDDGARTNVSTAVDKDLSYNNHVNYTISKVVGAPASGTYAADPYAVQVQLSVQKALGFSGMFLGYTPTITASGTATVVPSGKYCVISLETQSVTGIDATGSTNVNLGCGMITNSVSMSAAVATGSSSVTASPIAAVGGIPASTHWGSGTVLQPFTVEQPDPFANVTPTAPATCNAAVTVNPSEVRTDQTNSTATTSDDALEPGCYAGLNLKGTVRLKTGTYYIDGGDFTVNSGAVIDCDQCVIVMSNRDPTSNSIGDVDLNGNATVRMTSPDSGTYSGILFYQDRRAAADNNIMINGNSDSTFRGAFYFPKADLTFNGTAGMHTECMQIVAKDVSFTGNSSISNTCPSGGGAHSFDGKKVRLVA